MSEQLAIIKTSTNSELFWRRRPLLESCNMATYQRWLWHTLAGGAKAAAAAVFWVKSFCCCWSIAIFTNLGWKRILGTAEAYKWGQLGLETSISELLVLSHEYGKRELSRTPWESLTFDGRARNNVHSKSILSGETSNSAQIWDSVTNWHPLGEALFLITANCNSAAAKRIKAKVSSFFEVPKSE